MLNNTQFTELQRRLWREGNPLADELVSTRDELIYLLREAQKVIDKYSPVINRLSEPSDMEFFQEWDNFADTIENMAFELGEKL